MVSDAYGETDAQYTHPRHEYHGGEVARRAQQTMREQDADWSTPHRFWSAGHDSSAPDAREVRLIADCAAALAEEADVFHSTVEEFQKCVVAEVGPDLPVLRGEMRYYRNNMEDSPLYAWITSARMDLKMENFRTERLLGQVAEPLAVFASLNGAPWPGGFVDEAWHWLLQNHGHDSIGGCSREVVPLDMFYRYRQSREIATCVLERAALDLAGSIDLSAHPADSVAVVAYNPSPLSGSYPAEVTVDIPQEWKQKECELVDAEGNAVPWQLRSRDTGRYTVVQAPNEAANMYECDRVKALALFPGLPSMGYRTFFVRPLAKATKKRVESLVTAPDAMENEHLRVRVCPNGTLEVTDKASGRVFHRLGYFHDSSEIGNPWERVQVPQEEILTTLNGTPRISLVHDGDLEAAFRIEHDWELPVGRNPDEKTRSRQRVACKLSTLVSLRRGQRWVEFVTDLDNRAEDHYLQVCFPTGVQTPVVSVQTPFDVVSRPVAMPDPGSFAENPMSEQPMDGFVDRSDGRHGVALMVEGMKAYTAHEDAEGTLGLTLLRSFPLRICITNLEVTDYSKVDRASQCLGQHRFRYAFLPHAGDWRAGGVWNDTVRFHSIPVVAQIAPSAEGTEPLEKSFLEIEPATVHVSAVKRAENGHGWVVR
ncbi:MAG: hypothetical protein HC901_01805, partial [Bdellovibrionaceae bacterium]|nr:hypothetical protein [Pseudobdellovibrionaceae bacterium]